MFSRRRSSDSSIGKQGYRTIAVNDDATNATQHFLHNRVTTAKYTMWTFFPKFFREQFSKYANLFFLVISCIQFIPDISPTNQGTTIVPLSIVLIAAGIKELYEDRRRKKNDDVANNSICQKLNGGRFVDTAWKDVAVGNLVRVEGGSYFPADILLLSSSEPEGLCYVETANLDGETSLKIKQALPETSSYITSGAASTLRGTLKAELPNNSLYTFEGTLELNGLPERPVGPNQILLRGSLLRNCHWVYGLVIYTGHETRLMRNATAAPIKQTNVERATNVQILNLVLLLLILTISSATGSLLFASYNSSPLPYLFPESDRARLATSQMSSFFGRILLTFTILYNNIIPISLIVTMEFVRIIIGYLINNDIEMYHEETDTPAVTRTSTLVEELGQIEYIFSDKTGTLTCNEMRFRKCSIGGVIYADEPNTETTALKKEHSFSELAKAEESSAHIPLFLMLMAVCHTVVPERSNYQEDSPTMPDPNKDQISYQASSPDEAALVLAAKRLGYIFHTRRPRCVVVHIHGQDELFEILNVCEFNSTRKRMSVIVKCPDGTIRLLTKGADTVIYERLASSASASTSKDGTDPHTMTMERKTLKHLDYFASEGLRTLCLATRVIPEDEYVKWNVKFDEASTTINNRHEALDQVIELIEHNLELLGATAIEDRLQDGVPNAISQLALAGIKVWVLTGDRQETAINVGYSCRLLNNRMNLIIVNESSLNTVKDTMQAHLNAIKHYFMTCKGALPRGYYDPNRPPKGCFGRFMRRFKSGTKDVDIEMSNISKENGVQFSSDQMALVIDGKSLQFALYKQQEDLFLSLASLCSSVICCRVSPLQKAQVVRLVKSKLSAITLAIGDGANDVSMIQSAHVGVGISGKEGMQAARSADFTIGQFRFLRRLLFVHGSWSYDRLSKVILYCFYKNITLYMTQFWFQTTCAFSGQTAFESWLLASYNVFFTSLPVLAIGILDQFVCADMLLKYPQIYALGRRNAFFNVRIFWGWALNGIYHSAILFYLIWFGISGNEVVRAHSVDIWYQNAYLYTIVLFVVTCKGALIVRHWTYPTLFTFVFSLIFFFIFLLLLAEVGPLIRLSRELIGIPVRLYETGIFWLSIMLMVVLCLIRDFSWKYLRRDIWFEAYHIIQEIQSVSTAAIVRRPSRRSSVVTRGLSFNRTLVRRGFAFAQNETGEAKHVQQYDTLSKKPDGK